MQRLSNYLQTLKSARQRSFMEDKIFKIGRFLQLVGRRFFENDGTYRAAALTFTSLLAIVPLMSVMFTVFSAFPVFQKINEPIQSFIFENFVPETGQVVQEYLNSFVLQASKLSMIGIVFLLIMAILLMITIEQALNQIWRVRQRRKTIAAFILYWTILTLAPVLSGVSLLVSSYLGSIPFLHGTVHTIGMDSAFVLQCTPFLLMLFAFTLIYVAVPNTKVRIRDGFVGALVAAILFELARFAFTLYLRHFPTYQLLYGAFATVPIFFLWVYWVWTIVLLGAEVSHALNARYDRRFGPELDPMTHAMCWLHHLWQAQLAGKSLSLQQLIDADIYNYHVEPERQIQVLHHAKLIRMTRYSNIILSRDLSTVNLAKLIELLPWRIPKQDALNDIELNYLKPWRATLTAYYEQNKDLFSVNVKTILAGE